MARCMLTDKGGRCRAKVTDMTVVVLDHEGDEDYLTLEVGSCPRHTVWMRLQTPAVEPGMLD